MEGITETVVGYCGGEEDSPTYKRIQDYTEAIRITYDPNIKTFEDLVRIFWSLHSPYPNVKTQYQSVIWYTNEEEKALVELIQKEKNWCNYEH
mmetsp:Transcript_37507/g.48531  ORF Transcript_37507/g.48531 Transcript_37507/m.48531 type:complete len:93 (+) Transcript_37507:132-410(+)